MEAAKKSDWLWEDMPAKRVTIPLDRSFSTGEIERIRLGVVPEQMEDKWFIYWQENKLFFHRSWTGFCVYVVRFAKDNNSNRMVEADVNRDPEEYRETSDTKDAAMISFLIDVLLLEQEADFPSDECSSDKMAVMRWITIGRAGFGERLGRG